MPEANEQITQTVADPIQEDTTIVPSADGDMTLAGESVPNRERDNQGRFVSADPAPTDETPAEQPPPKFSPQMMDQARAVQLTDEQIDSFDDPGLLWDVIQGRQAQITPPPAAPQTPQAPVSQATAGRATAGQVTGYNNLEPEAQPAVASSPVASLAEPILEDFTLELDDDEVAPELAKPVKALAEHVNKLKASLVKQVNELRAQNAELQLGVRDSAARAQVATTQQQAGMWDQIAESIPGMVDAIGKPSIAMAQAGSNNANAWSELAPFITARAQSQRVPEHLIDYPRAAREGWTAYQAVNGNKNGQSSGNPNGLPGVAVRSASRTTTVTPPASGEPLSVAEDHERRLASMENIIQQNGGVNPFM